MLAVAALALTGCATTDAVTPRAIATPSVRPAGAEMVRTSASPPDPTNCTASYPPPTTMPTPGQMPAGSWMAHIQARGYLIAGVAQTTYLWSFRNPGTAQLEGFDIDMVEQVNRGHLRTESTASRLQDHPQRRSRRSCGHRPG